MKLTANQLGILAVGAAIAGALFYVACNEAGGSRSAPEYAGDTNLFYSGLNTMICRADQGDQCSGHEWHVPLWDQLGFVVSRHRYPELTGSNGSAVIHHGFSAMMKPAPSDTSWIERPPGEMMW